MEMPDIAIHTVSSPPSMCVCAEFTILLTDFRFSQSCGVCRRRILFYASNPSNIHPWPHICKQIRFAVNKNNHFSHCSIPLGDDWSLFPWCNLRWAGQFDIALSLFLGVVLILQETDVNRCNTLVACVNMSNDSFHSMNVNIRVPVMINHKDGTCFNTSMEMKYESPTFSEVIATVIMWTLKCKKREQHQWCLLPDKILHRKRFL